jgi:subtilisin family serine protease
MRSRGSGWVVVLMLLACLCVGTATAAAAGRDGQTHASPAQRISAELQRQLSTRGPDEATTVIVTLRDQATLALPLSLTRRERLRRVVVRLQREASTTQGPIRRMLADSSARWVRPLWVFNGLIVRATEPVIRRLAELPAVDSVDPNVVVARAADAGSAGPQPEPNIALAGAPTLWAQGNMGQGMVVANLDTGVDASHPDLTARWRGGANSWFDPYDEHPTTPTDVAGHGTQTMGVIVGGDAGGTAIGMAPGAQWIAAKIFNDRGAATTAGIHEAFQWVLDPDGDTATADAPNVVNNSWTFQAPGCDLSFQSDLEALRAAGILPVFAAGNGGPAGATSYSPANNPGAFAVGATDNTDAVASFSSRGPSACGEETTTFPELTAPGVGVNTADLYGFWTTGSGTSLAGPHVAGALALLLSTRPGLSVEQQESALEQGAADLGGAGPDNDSGWGRLDAAGAADWLSTTPDFAVGALPAVAEASTASPAEFTVNVQPILGFTGDVALSLDGLSSADVTATFAPATIAGGAGTSTLSVTPARGLPPGSYPLTITGTNGATTRHATVQLDVMPQPDFSLSATPPALTVHRGDAASYTATVGSVGGYSAAVSLSAKGLPAHSRATLSPNPVVPPNTSTLRIKTNMRTPLGKYRVRIVGVSGRLRHRVGIDLTVRRAHTRRRHG